MQTVVWITESVATPSLTVNVIGVPGLNMSSYRVPWGSLLSTVAVMVPFGGSPVAEFTVTVASKSFATAPSRPINWPVPSGWIFRVRPWPTQLPTAHPIPSPVAVAARPAPASFAAGGCCVCGLSARSSGVGSALVDVAVDDDDGEVVDDEDDGDALRDDDATELESVDEDPSSEHAAMLKPAAAMTLITVRCLNPDTWR